MLTSDDFRWTHCDRIVREDAQQSIRYIVFLHHDNGSLCVLLLLVKNNLVSLGDFTLPYSTDMESTDYALSYVEQLYQRKCF